MATDQEIRDRGFKYIPQQKYLQNPFELPENQEPVVDEGIVNTNAFAGSGGDNFNVYNPDPNSIVNREYDPRPYYDATYEDTFGTNAKDPLSNFTMTGDPEILGAGDTGGQFYEPPPSRLEGLLSMLPYAGSFVRGARFLGDQISPFLPVNRRSILENELAGQGIMVNDIGQIVAANQGSAYDPSGSNIMAGYNANKVTQETFDKRRAKAKDKMSEEGFKKFDAALTAAEEKFFGAKDQTDKIYDFEEDEKKKKKKDTVINRFITKKKEAKAAADAVNADETSVGNYPTGGSYNAPGGVTDSNYNQAANIAGGGGGNQVINTPAGPMTAREATYDNDKSTGTSQGYSQHYSEVVEPDTFMVVE